MPVPSAEEIISERVEAAVQKLFNVVEALSADKKSLADEVQRLRKLLEQKKKDSGEKRFLNRTISTQVRRPLSTQLVHDFRLYLQFCLAH
jgi:ribosomal protein S15P/S13E